MTQTPVIVFDFDGTVALGHGPVRAYARETARSLPTEAAERMLAEFERTIDEAPDADEAPLDGYDLVRRAALAAGASEEALAEGYAASRRLLATAHAPVTAPNGLADFLRASASAHRVLVTNAPNIRVIEALDGLGLGGLFDRVITAAGKPAGFEAILDDLAPVGSGIALLSIGDVWHNDLEPAQRRGHATALVGKFTPASATPQFRAELLEELYPALTSWLESALAGERANTNTTATPTPLPTV